MKLRYQAYHPADTTELAPRKEIARGEVDVPDDAEDEAVLDALRQAVAAQAHPADGAQIRVIAYRDDEDEPHYWHVWDHEAGG